MDKQIKNKFLADMLDHLGEIGNPTCFVPDFQMDHTRRVKVDMENVFLKKLTEITEAHLSDSQFGVEEPARGIEKEWR